MTKDHGGEWSAELRVRLGGLPLIALPLIALCVLAVFMRSFFDESRSADYELYQSVQVQSRVLAMQARLVEADAVGRNYLTQQKDAWLVDYRGVVATLPKSLNALQKQVSLDRVASQRIGRLQPILEGELGVLAEMREYSAKPGASPAALPDALVTQSNKAIADMRVILSEELEATDRRTQKTYLGAMEAQNHNDLILFSTLAFGLFGGLGGVWMLMSKVIATERRRAEMTVEEGQEQLQAMLRQAEAQAQEHRYQTQMLQSIVHSMGEGLVVFGSDGQNLVCNQAAEQILENLSSTPISDWVSRYGLCASDGKTPCTTDELALTRALRGEEVDRTVRFAANARTGACAWLSMVARPLRDESGIPRAAVLVLTDITEDKQNEDALNRAKEEAERANQAKSDYLSRMSHELRTPLNAILGFGQLLEMGRLDTKSEESVGQILKAGRHLLSLINEVLDISRIESGRLSLSVERVQAHLVMQEALAMVATQASSRQISITDETVGEMLNSNHYCVLADQQRLKQVLLNLLSNAIKYNRTGGTVTMTAARTKEQVRIRISDTGHGIAPEKLPLLFQPFERLGAERTEVEGTGIGLALSKRLVELMSGNIGVESELGVGTTFWVEFAAAEPPDGGLEFSKQLASAAQAVEANRPPVVLCIEDNPSNLRLIEQIFTSLPDVCLVSASTGEEGLKQAVEHRPRLILLDVHLPDLDGRAVLVRLKADPITAAIPVLVVSADATARQELRMREAGALGYITKPVDVQKLLNSVEEVLGKYAATV
jgi:signal transduction histidine kinase/ActR/RegA family two-component response regulator